MREVLDHLQRKVQLKGPVKRIVSLCPSQTETIVELGAGDRLVGITRYCVSPANVTRHIKKVGGTKQVDLNLIRELRPDLVIAEKEENTSEMVEALEQFVPVYVTDVRSYESAIRMIQDCGELLNLQSSAMRMVSSIVQSFSKLPMKSDPKRTLYLIWQNPVMVAGQDTFINAMLDYLGAVNLGVTGAGRYPEFSLGEIEALQPELLLLSSEPYPFVEKHRVEWEERLPKCRVLLVEGELFSWYGSRMRQMPAYYKILRELIDSHPT